MAGHGAARGRRRRLAILWTPLSALFHGAIAYSLVASVTCKPDPIGSQEIELDLIAPRLAPPLRVNGTARELSRGDDDQKRGERAADEEKRGQRAIDEEKRGQRAVVARPAPRSPSKSADAARPERVLPMKAAPKRIAAKARAAARKAKALAALAKSEKRQKRSPRPEVYAQGLRRRPADTARPRTRPERDLLRTMAAVDPDETIPFHVAKASRQERERRRALRAERLAASRASDARVAATLARMNAAARAVSVGGRLGVGGKGGGRGSVPRIGLRFYLSGRRVASSRVVRPPEPLSLPRKVCTLRRAGTAPTTVRMLVSKDGDVTVAYIKRRSGDRRFDRCARKMARQMRFRPGEDLAGNALNVWIHLIVEPRVRATAVANAPLGG